MRITSSINNWRRGQHSSLGHRSFVRSFDRSLADAAFCAPVSLEFTSHTLALRYSRSRSRSRDLRRPASGRLVLLLDFATGATSALLALVASRWNSSPTTTATATATLLVYPQSGHILPAHCQCRSSPPTNPYGEIFPHPAQSSHCGSSNHLSIAASWFVYFCLLNFITASSLFVSPIC